MDQRSFVLLILSANKSPITEFSRIAHTSRYFFSFIGIMTTETSTSDPPAWYQLVNDLHIALDLSPAAIDANRKAGLEFFEDGNNRDVRVPPVEPNYPIPGPKYPNIPFVDADTCVVVDPHIRDVIGTATEAEKLEIKNQIARDIIRIMDGVPVSVSCQSCLRMNE